MKIEAVPLDELSQQVAACHACSLCEGRTNTVFGEGDPRAGIMLIGEAPGRYEDLQGRPFVVPLANCSMSFCGMPIFVAKRCSLPTC